VCCGVEGVLTDLRKVSATLDGTGQAQGGHPHPIAQHTHMGIGESTRIHLNQGYE
jgi:hypothetical protein